MSGDLAPQKRVEQIWTFNVPKKLSDVTGIKSIGIVEMRVEDEVMATRRANGDRARLAWELALQALVRANGKEVSIADGSADIVFNKHPKLRNLIVTAYGQVHQPEEDEAKDFLGSMELQST